MGNASDNPYGPTHAAIDMWTQQNAARLAQEAQARLAYEAQARVAQEHVAQGAQAQYVSRRASEPVPAPKFNNPLQRVRGPEVPGLLKTLAERLLTAGIEPVAAQYSVTPAYSSGRWWNRTHHAEVRREIAPAHIVFGTCDTQARKVGAPGGFFDTVKIPVGLTVTGQGCAPRDLNRPLMRITEWGRGALDMFGPFDALRAVVQYAAKHQVSLDTIEYSDAPTGPAAFWREIPEDRRPAPG